jgi:outer membrane protein
MKIPSRISPTLRVAVLLTAIGLTTTAFCAEDYKIGVINPERILREAAPAKEAAKRLEEEFKSRDAAVGKSERELRELTTRFERESATLSESDRAARQRDIESRGRELERLRRQLSEDLKTRQFDEMNKLKERLDALLTKIAKEQGYDLILQDGVYVGKSVDMTDLVIKALSSP